MLRLFFSLFELRNSAAAAQLACAIASIQLCMAKTSPDQSQQFNSMLLTAIVIAAILAVGVVWLVYGCARETNTKPKLARPGMFAVQSLLK